MLPYALCFVPDGLTVEAARLAFGVTAPSIAAGFRSRANRDASLHDRSSRPDASPRRLNTERGGEIPGSHLVTGHGPERTRGGLGCWRRPFTRCCAGSARSCTSRARSRWSATACPDIRRSATAPLGSPVIAV